MAVQEFAHDAIKAVLPDFEAATGLTVKLESGPVSGNDMLIQVRRRLRCQQQP